MGPSEHELPKANKSQAIKDLEDGKTYKWFDKDVASNALQTSTTAHKYAKVDSNNGDTRCEHISSVAPLSYEKSIIRELEIPLCSAEGCGQIGEVSLCLVCQSWFCGRYVDGHIYEHFRTTNHSITMSFKEPSIWCQACSCYLDYVSSTSLRDYYIALCKAKFIGTDNNLEVFDIEDSSSRTGRDTQHEHKVTAFCSHVENLSEDFDKIPLNLQAPCQYNKCNNKQDNAICLACAKVFCCELGDQHMGLHHLKYDNHYIYMFFHNLSTWCRICDRYIDYNKYDNLYNIVNMYYKIRYGVDAPRGTTGNDETSLHDSSSHQSQSEKPDPAAKKPSGPNGYALTGLKRPRDK